MEAHLTIARTKHRKILELYTKKQHAKQLENIHANGLCRLMQRTGNNEVVGLPTHNSGRMSTYSFPNYLQAIHPHFAKMKVINFQAHEVSENIFNAHMMMWPNILGSLKRRVSNFHVWNTDIPALYGLHKGQKKPPNRCRTINKICLRTKHRLQLQYILFALDDHTSRNPDVTGHMCQHGRSSQQN